MQSVLLDAAGHRRSPATMPSYHRGRPPPNKGEEYPAVRSGWTAGHGTSSTHRSRSVAGFRSGRCDA